MGALALAAGVFFGAEWVLRPGVLLTVPLGWLGVSIDPLSLAADAPARRCCRFPAALLPPQQAKPHRSHVEPHSGLFFCLVRVG